MFCSQVFQHQIAYILFPAKYTVYRESNITVDESVSVNPEPYCTIYAEKKVQQVFWGTYTELKTW